MMRKLTAACAGLGALLLASAASAQEHQAFGQKGQFIISADRLFPLFQFTHVAQDTANVGAANKMTTTVNSTSISLLWGSTPAQAAGGGIFISPFTVPRVGVDYLIINNVTIGGDLILFFTLGGSTSVDTTNGAGATQTQSQDNPGQLLFGIAPRGGYILPLNDMFSLWLRGGFSYFIESSKTTAGNLTTTNTLNQLALDLDPQFVVTMIPHVGFTAGLTFDVPLTGGHSTDTSGGGASTSQSAGSSLLFFGVTLGMFAYF